MKNVFAKFISLAVLLAAGFAFAAGETGVLRDSRDGKIYKTVKIGNQEWMAENLNYDYNQGSAKSVCYNNDPENCKIYGRLYNWAAAVDSAAKFSSSCEGCGFGYGYQSEETIRGVCPEGWHLPSKMEFETLVKKVGGRKESKYEGVWARAGKALKSSHSWRFIEFWEDGGSKPVLGSDAFGFRAMPGGEYFSGDEKFKHGGEKAYFWSSTEDSEYGAYRLDLYYHNDYTQVYHNSKLYGFSVRCVKNSNKKKKSESARLSVTKAQTLEKTGTLTDYRDGKKYKTFKVGGMTWMGENLNFKTWKSMCYTSKSENCEKYGRLYVWRDALSACPRGWHLPNSDEFLRLQTLAVQAGGFQDDDDAYPKNKKNEGGLALKSRQGWEMNGTDAIGFNALPAGVRTDASNFKYGRIIDGYFENGAATGFWASNLYLGAACRLDVNGEYDGSEVACGNSKDAYSVRCVKNEPTPSLFEYIKQKFVE